MPKKGVSNNPAGKPKGTLAKATIVGREAIGRFVDGNAETVMSWLHEIKEQNGALAAFNAYMSVVEYHIPKLSRAEYVGDKEKPIAIADVTDIKQKVLKAIPDDQLRAILARDNNG
jgi:hypothetical protein